MTPLMLYWAVCIVVCAAVIAGTVLRQLYLRRQQRGAMTAAILPMERSADYAPPRSWLSFAAANQPADGERRRGVERRRNRGDRRARPQA